MPGLNGALTDIVPLLDPSAIKEAQFFTLGFPKNSSFHFYGYSGIDDTDVITDAIKSAAIMCGSRIRGSRRKAKSSTRVMQVDLYCVKSKWNSSKMKFNDNSLQGNNTIIQREHQIASRKGRSRSSTNKFVHSENCSEEENNVTPVRRSTSLRPLEKKNCCNFKFTIFCCSKTNKWYLSYSQQ